MAALVRDAVAADMGPRTAQTTYGPVVGRKLAKGGVLAFFHVPYARAPVGALRFRAPLPPERWTAPLDVSTKPAGMERGCPQLSDLGELNGTEDCLKLIVYTPGLRRRPPLPVMFWIHGGGLSTGDALGAGAFHGAVLARNFSVVVASVQYRLGLLGFLAMEEARAERGDGAVGNYGFLDQRAGLRWVGDNIAEFGGDPRRVTIFGESAGGMSVCFHLASPGSRGLFAGAIMQSGSCDLGVTEKVLGRSTSGVAFDFAAKAWTDFRSLWKCPEHLGLLECMRGMDVHRLVEDRQIWHLGLLMVDGTDTGLPGRPLSLIASGRWNRVPVIAGYNHLEYRTRYCPLRQRWLCPFRTSIWSYVPGTEIPLRDAGLRRFIEHMLVRNFTDAQWAEVMDQYPGKMGAKIDDIATDAGYWASGSGYRSTFLGQCGTLRAAEAMMRSGATVWAYHYRSDAYGEIAQHSDDIGPVFGHTFSNGTEAERRVAERFATYWTNFAKFGDPNGPKGASKSGRARQPRWAPLAERGQVAEFNASGCSMAFPHRRRFCTFWQGLLGTQAWDMPRDAAAAPRPAGPQEPPCGGTPWVQTASELAIAALILAVFFLVPAKATQCRFSARLVAAVVALVIFMATTIAIRWIGLPPPALVPRLSSRPLAERTF